MKNVFTAMTAWVAMTVLANRALACAVCGGGQDKAQGAFLLSTSFLSLVPIVILVGVGYFVYRKSNANHRS